MTAYAELAKQWRRSAPCRTGGHPRTRVGQGPFRLAELWEEINTETKPGGAVPVGRSQAWLVPGENPLDQNTRTFATIEIACLDGIGKAIGRPVCDLLGGRVRNKVPFSAYLFYKHAGRGGDN